MTFKNVISPVSCRVIVVSCDSCGGFVTEAGLVKTPSERGDGVIDVWILNGPVKCSYIREGATKKWWMIETSHPLPSSTIAAVSLSVLQYNTEGWME